MKKLGLIGYPIQHSLSPYLFREAYYNNLHIKTNFSYDIIEHSDFEQSVSYIEKNNYLGVNVTAPFKKKAYDYCSQLDPIAEKIGVVNLMLYRNRSIFGFNTDYLAVKTKLEELFNETGRSPETTNIVVIGYGGAGKAAATASIISGANTYIVNRTEVQDKKLTERTGVKIEGFSSLPGLLKKCQIIIYTIPASLPDSIMAATDLSGKIVFEANYRTPALSPSLTDNYLYISGKEWLVLQAIKGFEIFTGEKPDIEAMRKIL